MVFQFCHTFVALIAPLVEAHSVIKEQSSYETPSGTNELRKLVDNWKYLKIGRNRVKNTWHAWKTMCAMLLENISMYLMHTSAEYVILDYFIIASGLHF